MRVVLVFDIFIYFKYSFKILDKTKNTYLHNNDNICGLILLKFMQKSCKVILICGFELLLEERAARGLTRDYALVLV